MRAYKLKDIISQGTKDLFYIWWQELKAVVKDQGTCEDKLSPCGCGSLRRNNENGYMEDPGCGGDPCGNRKETHGRVL